MRPSLSAVDRRACRSCPVGEAPAVVAIDTLNRSLFGSESSDEDMSAYVRAADAVRDAFDCAVLLIHHCGHNADRPRGPSSLLGAADALISVKRDDADNILATIEETKDGERGMVIISHLAVKELGADADGDTISSCVVEAVGEIGDAPTKAAQKWPKALSIFKRTLDAALGSTGRRLFPFADGPEVLAVKRENHRVEFMKVYPADRKAKGEAFRRYERSAVTQGLLTSREIGEGEDAEMYFWLTP
jgi:AAA domain